MLRSAQTPLIALALVVVSLAVYAQTASFDFIELDDDRYVAKNQELLGPFGADAVAWAFEPVVRIANWQPVVLLSYRFDASRHGIDDAGPYHATNVFWHIAATLLLFAALRSMTGRDVESGLVAAVFALHPLHVESVAWVSSRKDVLVAAGWWAATWAYVVYVHSESSARRVAAYCASLLALTLALLAKPLAVTLPFALLLFDYWPLRRFRLAGDPASAPASAPRLIAEKLPFLALAFAASVATLIVQSEGGAMESGKALTLLERLANATVAYGTYIAKSFWPTQLGLFYPHPTATSQNGLAPLEVVAALALLVACTYGAVAAARRSYASIAIGWCFFLGTLVPMMGIVQVGFASHADRYTYVSQTGLAIALVFGASEALRRHRPEWLRAGLVLAIALCCALGIAAHRQAALWRDTPTLFEHTLAVTERNDLIEYNYGTWLKDHGDSEGAKARFVRALRWNPDKVDAAVNLGLLLHTEGERERGLALLQGAVAKAPTHVEANLNLGIALAQAQDWGAARERFEAVLDLGGESKASDETYQALLSIATIDNVQGDYAGAATFYERALAQRPDDPRVLGALVDLAIREAASANGDRPGAGRAIDLARRAAQLSANSAESLERLARAYWAWGDRGAAASALDRALERARTDDPARVASIEALRARLGSSPRP